jgi:hypothetical protein
MAGLLRMCPDRLAPRRGSRQVNFRLWPASQSTLEIEAGIPISFAERM